MNSDDNFIRFLGPNLEGWAFASRTGGVFAVPCADQAKTEAFSVIALLYNAKGILTQQVTSWDNGTTSYTYF